MNNVMEPLPDQVVVTTDAHAFARRRNTQLGIVFVTLAAAVVLAVVLDTVEGRIIMGSALALGAAILFFGQVSRERRLAAVERPLVLDRAGFDLVLRGQQLRFSWSQLQDLTCQQQGGLWFNHWWDLVFVLTPQARASVTTSPTIADRMLMWNAGAVRFSHPAPSPDVVTVDWLIRRYWAAANGLDFSTADPKETP
ncbi:MAG: hypothetical protein FWH11_02300 [Micrococcales bacterium]|nr:hypothetical protein [Micrococcales bacterium]